MKAIYGAANPNTNDKGCSSNYWMLCCGEVRHPGFPCAAGLRLTSPPCSTSQDLPPSRLAPMHEFVNVLEYARLRDSFNGGRTISMDTSQSTMRTVSYGGDMHNSSAYASGGTGVSEPLV